MINFNYAQPVKIEFGAGKIQEIDRIAKECGYKIGVLLCDKLFAQNGVADDVCKANATIKAVFSDITPNPTLQEVENATKLMKNIGADFVVALGGGSSMDLGKFAACMVNAECDVRDYFYQRAKFIDGKALPLIAVPTTAGTGSEVTSVSVCNDEKNGVKAPLSDKNFFAYMALVDPELTLSVPPFVTATTGLDAMAHAFEAYWCNAHNPLSDDFAVGALKLLFANLEKAYLDGTNLDVRSAMCLGSLTAGLAFAPTRTAAVHACSYPLSMECHLCHGEACAFTLDSFILVNGEVENERMTALANILGFDSIKAMADEVLRLKKVCKMKTTLKEIGADDKAFVEKLASACIAHPLFKNNPTKPTQVEMVAILEGLE